MLSVQILGTGEYVPAQTVASSTLDQGWNKPAGWTERHSGIRHRHYAGGDETTSLMGARAARSALAAAGLEPGQLDCIVSACSVMEQAIPCSAVFVQRQLGLGDSGIPAFDVNATCLSFLAAMDTVSTAIVAGRYRRVLIVSSEIPSAGLPEGDAETSMLFGDGAGAVILGPAVGDSGSGVMGCHFETYGSGADLCRVRSGGTRLRPRNDIRAFLDGACFEMQGRRTYRMAAARLPVFLERLFTRAGVAIGDIHRIIPHQASAKALAHLQTLLKLSADKLECVLAERGNQMAASIPVALHHAVAAGRVKRGDVVALIGSGAGLSFGGVVLRY